MPAPGSSREPLAAAREWVTSWAMEFEVSRRASQSSVVYLGSVGPLYASANHIAHQVGWQPTWTVASWCDRLD